MAEKMYAIIDGASVEQLFKLLEEENPPCSCLYQEPVQAELIPLAPYLVLATDAVQAWLKKRNDLSWGIYVTTSSNMKDLRTHLRKYLQVLLPNEQKLVFMILV